MPADPTTPSGAASRSDWLRSVLRYDVPASLVVFLVALPLSIGIAVASGAGAREGQGVPIMAGIIAAIVGGIVAGLLGGSAVQVSGPAAGLTVVVAELVQEFGFKTLCLIVIAAGLVQILFGVSRLARAALAISPVVVHAMLAGIGVTIALQQIHIVLGGKPASAAWANISALPGQIANFDYHDALIGGLVIVALLGWRYLPKGLQKVPGPLVVIAAAIGLTALLDWGDVVKTIEIDDNFLAAIHLPSAPHIPMGEWGEFAVGVLTVAIIASVESLLSAVAVDKLHKGPRANFDRELIGQGAANTVSGILGGLPVTGVIVRSSANVAAGARSRASAILHGVWMLLFALLFLGAAENIPKSALAGLLVVIGVQLVKLADIQKARKTGDFLVYAVTIFGVVFLNLLEGVLIGLAVALALVFWRVVRVHVTTAAPREGSEDRWQVAIEGSATFLALPKLTEAFAEIPRGASVVIVMAVDFLDHAAQSAIEDWCFQHEATGGNVVVQEVGSVDLAGAGDAPPKRGSLGDVLRRGLTPWDSWRPGGLAVEEAADVSGPDATAHPAVRSVLAGVAHYHRRHAPLLLPHLEKLRHIQNPDILFITCGDSRIVPNVITSSGPGDLFTIRNVGNLVKPAGTDAGMDAALEFSVNNLGVRSIVLCGHSSCGAMADLPTDLPAGHPLAVWLDRVELSRQTYEQGHPVAADAAVQGYGPKDQLSMVNVLMQVQSLQQHPVVAKAVAERGLSVTGLFFDISTGNVLHVAEDNVTIVDDRHPLLLSGEEEPQTAAAALSS
ncbi:MAG: SulP family inorganic anion transporter [Segniliparus sp.]|uniref:SulP family inorganic anion transporter n=1 Tax=Segniliparus sp. TaxID=2804064 RepID=UPI003F3D0167